MARALIDIWCINMNSALAAMMLADAQAVTAEAGQTVTINAVNYAAMVSDASLSQNLEAGGLLDNISTTVKIPATPAVLAASAYMALGKKLTWNSRTFRITAKTTKPGSAWVQLAVVDDDAR